MTLNKSLSNYGTKPNTIKLEKFNFETTQPCPVCNFPIGALAGSKEAICRNCGFKDPCCE